MLRFLGVMNVTALTLSDLVKCTVRVPAGPRNLILYVGPYSRDTSYDMRYVSVAALVPSWTIGILLQSNVPLNFLSAMSLLFHCNVHSMCRDLCIWGTILLQSWTGQL